MTGSLFSLNAIVPNENFKLQVGSPKESFLGFVRPESLHSISAAIVVVVFGTNQQTCPG